MITDLPKYFSDVLKFNIRDTGLMAALPYVAMYICSFIFATFCDFCIRRKWHSITTGRKIYTTVCKYFNTKLDRKTSARDNYILTISTFAFVLLWYSAIGTTALYNKN